MEDTIRYFFSALFQGFAALITLGAMFYLYFKEQCINKLNRIEFDIQQFINVHNNLNIKAEIDSIGIELYTDNYLRNNQNFDRRNTVVKLLSEYKSINNKKENIEDGIPLLLRNTIIILITSISGLFITDYHRIINYFLIIVGLSILIFSFITLLKMKNFILKMLK